MPDGSISSIHSINSVRLCECADAALDELLEPLQRLTEEEKEEEEEDEKDKAAAELMAFVCHRRRLCPRLHVRPARSFHMSTHSRSFLKLCCCHDDFGHWVEQNRLDLGGGCLPIPLIGSLTR